MPRLFPALVAPFLAFAVLRTAGGILPASPALARADSPSPPPAPARAAGPELVPATSAEVLEAVRRAPSKIVLVNLWATWCTPCRQEFPDLLRFARAWKDRGVSLLLVSGDFENGADEARAFLASQGVDARSYRKNEPDEAFINAFDPAWSGALPATFVYDGSGKRLHSFLGPVTAEALEHVIAPLVGARP